MTIHKRRIQRHTMTHIFKEHFVFLLIHLKTKLLYTFFIKIIDPTKLFEYIHLYI